MSPHQTRSAFNSTTLLLAVLCLSLLGWRLLTRVGQYHSLVPGRAATVAFFDADERATSATAALPSREHPVPEQQDRLFAVVSTSPPLQAIRTSEPDCRTALPHICVRSIPLLSNPPPSLA